MTVSEAVSLVLQAHAIGEHGDILVLDMGEPTRILDLARTLIKLSGNSEAEIEIVFTGLRAGEKLYEQSFYESERVTGTSCEKIKRTQVAPGSWTGLDAQLQHLFAELPTSSDPEIRAMLKSVVPECQFDVEILAKATVAAG